MMSARTRHARQLFAPLPRTYDRMASLLSLGQDARWRRFLVSRVPNEAAHVLDVATGTAAVAIELMKQNPRRTVVCLDQSAPMLRVGVARTAFIEARPAFVLARGESPPFTSATFDALTFTYLFRYVDDPVATLRGLVELVQPGGTVAALEFGVPPGPWRPVWWLYTRLVLPVVGLVASRGWYEVCRFLGPSISGFYERLPLEAQLRMWREAGVTSLSVRRMSLGGGVIIWGRRAS